MWRLFLCHYGVYFMICDAEVWMRTTLQVIFVLGAVCMAVFPFDRKRVRAPWARWVFFTIAGLLLFLGAWGLGAMFRLWATPDYFGVFRANIRGFILGLFFSLIVSGQLLGRKVSV
jgi:hypothetical protein